MTTQFLELPDARIAYRIDGTGPRLFLVGAPVGIAGFEPLASRLASRFTIVRHDPRGIGLSTVAPGTVPGPGLLAGDLAALIEELSSEPATIFGTSGGAVTGLALLARRPELVRLLVAHEPPLFTLLRDGGTLLGRMDLVFALAERDPHAAMQAFADATEAFQSTDVPVVQRTRVVLPHSTAAEQARNRYFLGRMAPATVHYRPSLQSTAAARVIVAAGAASIGQPAWRASHALAASVGARLRQSPGNHLGLVLAADAFAQWLSDLLAPAPAA